MFQMDLRGSKSAPKEKLLPAGRHQRRTAGVAGAMLPFQKRYHRIRKQRNLESFGFFSYGPGADLCTAQRTYGGRVECSGDFVTPADAKINELGKLSTVG
jgi:hypothetical protein